jgi:hypothetical protein
MKFPVIQQKFSVRRNIFPVDLSRELFEKSLRCGGFLLQNASGRLETTGFPAKFPVSREFALETGAISTALPASQAVSILEKFLLLVSERPANIGLLWVTSLCKGRYSHQLFRIRPTFSG